MEQQQGHRRRRRRRRQRLIAALIVIVLVVIVVCFMFLRNRYGSSDTPSDYDEFYGLTSEESVMINYDHEVLTDYQALYLDGEVYLPYDFFHSMNARVYWDGTEQIMRYVTPEGILSTSPDTTSYTLEGEARTAAYPIVHLEEDQMYLSLSFFTEFTDIRAAFYEEPNRLVLSDQWGEESLTEITKDTQVRELGGNQSNVLTDVAEDDLVLVLEEMDDWSKVCTQDGFIGYVRNKMLGGNETVAYISDFVEPVYSHNFKEGTICMAWHQTTNQTANDLVDSVLSSTQGINVLSPTWFYLDDNEGGIASLASADYVTYCHERGIEVWALVSNLENPAVDTTAVLNTTSKRDALIDNLMNAALQYNLDGINVDFESLEGEAGTGFLEFIRELSMRCREYGITLSVDNYPPAAYNTFYGRSEQAVFADYVVLMAYDEHYNGSDEGSVASISFVRQAVEDTLSEVPANQTILGIPFYTRLWRLTSTAEGYDVSSEALGMTEAENRVAEYGASFVWLDELGQYYATFDADGSTYDIWLEDATSIALKLDVMKESSLAGCSFWKLGYEKGSVWDTIVTYVQ